MTNVSAYDDDAKVIEKLAEDNDLTECDVIEMFLEYLDDIKRDNNLV